MSSDRERTYYLDLLTLIEALAGQSALLVTEISGGKSSRKGGRGWVRIEKRKITDAAVEFNDGKRLTGPQAIKVLETSAEWTVTIEARQESHPASGPDVIPTPQVQYSPSSRPFVSNNDHLIPQLTQRYALFNLDSLNPEHLLTVRTVIAMIDGTRNIGQIKRLVRLPPNTTERIILWLADKKIVSFL